MNKIMMILEFGLEILGICKPLATHTIVFHQTNAPAEINTPMNFGDHPSYLTQYLVYLEIFRKLR